LIDAHTYTATVRRCACKSNYLQAVARSAEGALIFPSGTYICFIIRLTSKVDLYLSRACTILAAESPKLGELPNIAGANDSAGPAHDLGPGNRAKPFLDWNTIQVPEIEEPYLTPIVFAPLSRRLSSSAMSRNSRRPMQRLSRRSPMHAPVLTRDVHRPDFFAINAPSQANFALCNVSEIRNHLLSK
jgi:hypothetical protein